MKKVSWKIWLLLAVILGVLYGGYVFYQKQSDKAKQYIPITLKKGHFKQSVTSSGTIKAFREIEVKSRANGAILRLFVRDGDVVKRGQLLLELDKFDERSNVAQARADLDSARSSLASAEISYEDAQRHESQQKSLLANDFVTGETVAQAKSSRVLAKSALDRARSSVLQSQEKLKLAQRRYSETEISAPIGGVVLEKYIEEGQIISSGISSTTGGTALFKIGDMSKLLVAAEVDEVDVGKLSVGQPVFVMVDSFPNRKFKGRLTHISPQGTTKSNVTVFMVEIEVVDDERDLLKPGMTASAEIVISTKRDVLLLPLETMIVNKKGHFAWVKKGTTYEQRPIKIGVSNDESAEVISGLSEGETVYMKREVNRNQMRQRGNNNSRGGQDFMRMDRSMRR